jgi:hypothetical protein
MPGWTPVWNGTGKPENVQTAAQAANAFNSGPSTFHIYDIDGVLMGTMRGHAEEVAAGALRARSNQGRYNG